MDNPSVNMVIAIYSHAIFLHKELDKISKCLKSCQLMSDDVLSEFLEEIPRGDTVKSSIDEAVSSLDTAMIPLMCVKESFEKRLKKEGEVVNSE